MLVWIRNIFLFLIIAVAAAPWWPVLQEWRSSAPYRDYLADNAHPINLSAEGGDLDLPDSFYENRFFLVGEIHGMQIAQAVDLAMMQHLNSRIGLRHIMAEMDASQAARMNAYLASGDETLIQPIFEAWLGNATQWGNQQHMDKLRALYRWNAGLPANQQIIYFGVDRVHDMNNAQAWLAREIRGRVDGAMPAFTPLLTVLDTQSADAANLIAQIDDALPLLDADLAYIATNIRNSLDGQGRYQQVEANIATMVTDFGIGDDEPVYGFWGLFHSMSATVNDGARPLALRLRESDLPFADDIVTLTMTYANSQQNMDARMLPEQIRPDSVFFEGPGSQDNPYLMYLNGIGDMKAVAGDAPATIFQINQPGSPYANGARMATQTGLLTYVFRFELDPFEGFASDYGILIQDSPALTAYEG